MVIQALTFGPFRQPTHRRVPAVRGLHAAHRLEIVFLERVGKFDHRLAVVAQRDTPYPTLGLEAAAEVAKLLTSGCKCVSAVYNELNA